MPCWLSQAVVPQRAQAVSGGTGAANLGQSHCPGPWSQLCLGGWTGAKGHCCLSPLQGQGVCAVPQLSPELLSFSAEGGEGSVPCRICPCQGRGQQCWDMILVTPQSLECQGQSGLSQGTAGRSSQLAETGMSLSCTHSTGNRRVCPRCRWDLALPQASALQSWAGLAG